jgi:hypothetical protein
MIIIITMMMNKNITINDDDIESPIARFFLWHSSLHLYFSHSFPVASSLHSHRLIS